MATLESRRSADGAVSWRVRVRIKGQPEVTASFSRKTDAARWAQATEASIRERRYFKHSEASKHSVAEMIERFLEHEMARLPKVRRMMTHQLKWWRAELGPHLLIDLTPARVATARDKLKLRRTRTGAPITPATINRYLAALSIVCGTAVREWGWLDDNPLRKVKKLTEPRERVRFLSEDERGRLLVACRRSVNPYLYLIVVLALSTGARKQEILGLRWAAVDLKRGQLALLHTKNGERRTVPVTGLALELLIAHAKVRRLDTDLVFPSFKKRQRPIVIEDPWHKAMTSAGIEDFRFHDLRHSTASYLAMNGASLLEIAAVLGHKTLAMVKRYAHLSEAHTRHVVADMTRRMFTGAHHG
jgi:integrase